MKANLTPLARAIEKLEAEKWHEKNTKSNSVWDQPLFKDYLKALIASGETPEECREIEEQICFHLVCMNVSGLKGGPTLGS